MSSRFVLFKHDLPSHSMSPAQYDDWTLWIACRKKIKKHSYVCKGDFICCFSNLHYAGSKDNNIIRTRLFDLEVLTEDQIYTAA